MPSDPLISVTALAARLAEPETEPSLKIVDARWYLAKHGRDAAEEYRRERLPGAVRLDLSSELADTTSGLRNTLASREQLAAALGRKGLRREDAVVVYDSLGFSSARVAWILDWLGQAEVRILDGGLDAWRAAGQTLESGPPPPVEPAIYEPSASFDAAALISADELERRIGDEALGVVDARNAERFRGEVPDNGHIPGSRHLHYKDLFVPGTATFRPRDELEALFRERGLLDRPELASTCGSGVTACLNIWALRMLGRDARLYDGSWNEWHSQSRPVAVSDDAATDAGDDASR